MIISLNSLAAHLHDMAPLKDLVSGLNACGFEVEKVQNPAEFLHGFYVAEILTVAPHPDAQKLQICTVDHGKEPLQIVCGAPNARAGIKVVLALPGTVIPANQTALKKGQIRGIESQGMLCSKAELLLADDHEGIWELKPEAQTGDELVTYLQKHDPAYIDPKIEISVTPNRGDALSLRGIAREFSALGLGRFARDLISHDLGTQAPIPEVKIHVGEDCPIFAYVSISNVQNGPSPLWLQENLKARGVRPISKLVDVTNFIAHDLNHPMHVFDADKIGNLQVRYACDGEEILALDGKTYALKPSMMVIADDQKICSLAGIMGSEETGVQEETKNILLELAVWNPIRITETGRALNILSDARYRYERGVDDADVESTLKEAVRLITDLCGGEVSSLKILGKARNLKSISYNPKDYARRMGYDLPNEHQEEILNRLGFQIEKSSEIWLVTYPSWRHDISIPEDIIEEISRIHGLHHIPTLSLPAFTNHVSLPLIMEKSFAAMRNLLARGLSQHVSLSFDQPQDSRLFSDLPPVALSNPIHAEHSVMRQSLFPSLLRLAQKNLSRGINRVHVFEAGHVFHGLDAKMQPYFIAGLRMGTPVPASMHEKTPVLDFFHVKADVLSLINSLGFPEARIKVQRSSRSFYHPWQQADLWIGKTCIGHVGAFHPHIAKNFDLKTPVFGFEINVDLIPLSTGKALRPAFQASPYPFSLRDYAFVFPLRTEIGEITKIIADVDRKIIRDVLIFDSYQGPHIAEGFKSIAVQVMLQSDQETLSEASIQDVNDKIIAQVAAKLGGALRA